MLQIETLPNIIKFYCGIITQFHVFKVLKINCIYASINDIHLQVFEVKYFVKFAGSQNKISHLLLKVPNLM